MKRDDGTLALIDKDKADLFNFYFSRIGENLASALPDPEISQVNDQGSVCVREVLMISEVNLTQHNVRREIKKLKTNKSTGADNISPKLTKSNANCGLNFGFVSSFHTILAFVHFFDFAELYI